MDAQTFHDLNRVIERLSSRITSARYGSDRHGMIPPEHLADIEIDISDALDTLRILQEDTTTRLRRIKE